MSSSKEHVFFPGLNGLRFIAAFLVIFHHIEQIRFKFGLSHHWFDTNIREMGELGVTLFFVLSGFLITYLLIREKEKYQTISIGKFYLRRMLRIWPLYFLIACLALFIIPHISHLAIPDWSIQEGNHFGFKVLLYLLILPNVANIMFTTVPYAGQLWSIGVEEQFYLIWPLIIRYSKNYLHWLIGIIIFVVVVSGIFGYWRDVIIVEPHTHNEQIVSFISIYFNQLRISCMAIGGIGAYFLLNKKENILKIIYLKQVQIMVVLASIFMISQGIKIPFINHEFYGMLFAIIILNVATNPNTILKLETKWLDYLGKISYGIYMYHYIAIVVILKVLMHFFHFTINNSNQYLIFASCTVTLAIVFASASYHFFETPFLKLKHRFTKVESGN